MRIMRREVIIELRGEKYLVICREEKTFVFRKGEEGEIIEFTLNYLREKAEK